LSAWQAQGEARILQLASHYGFYAILKAKDWAEMKNSNGLAAVARPSIVSRLGSMRDSDAPEFAAAMTNKKVSR
jgi:hypothetical protein